MTERRIYLDNAATSFPKPDAVHESMARYARTLGASPGRGAYDESREAGRLVSECRSRIAELINLRAPENVVFTLNTSDALNVGIRGAIEPHIHSHLRDGAPRPHVVTTWMDHNSVLRPFNELASRGVIEQTRVACDPSTGLVEVEEIERAIRPETVLVALVHASNVSGTVQPVADVGRVCAREGVMLAVDAAQSLGHMRVDMEELGVDLLAAPGHKGLLGPLGTGFLAIRPGVEERLWTVREGGTGSVSERDTQPTTMPDRFEVGSHNAIGIIGLSEGIAHILDAGIDAIEARERALTRIMLEEIDGTEGIRLVGPPTGAHRVGVFSFVVEGRTPHECARELEANDGVLSRAGVHCAPLAHRTFGTLTDETEGTDRAGTVRLSVGPFTREEDVRTSARALGALARSSAAV